MKDQSPAGKKNLFSKLYLVLAIIALCAFLTAALSEKFQWFTPESSYSIEDFQKEVQKKSQYYQNRNRIAYEQFQREIQSAGKEHFRTAERNVERTVKEISNFKTSAEIIGLMVRDQFKKTNTAQQKVSRIISPLIITPCVSGAEEIKDVLKKFLLQVEENDNRFHAECARELQKLPKENVQKAAEGFDREIGKFHEQTYSMMQNKLFAAIGTGIEVILIRQTFSAFAKLTAKIAVKLGISAALPMADGPIPVGDILAVVGAGWAAVDLYIVLKVMPEKLKKTLHQAISTCRNDMRENAIRQAAEAYRSSKQNMENLTRKAQENNL